MKFPSSRSIYHFIKTNSFLFFTGTLEFFTHFIHPIYTIYPITLIRNEILLYSIEYLVKDHPYVNAEKRILPKEKFPFEFQLYVIGNTTIEAFTSYCIYQFWYSHSDSILWKYTDLFYFIPNSFLFELIFDFFHYWTHRGIHEIPFLYKHIHKTHHTYSYPNVFIAYYQHPFDLILTNLLPTLFSFYILQNIFHLQAIHDVIKFPRIMVFEMYLFEVVSNLQVI
jgi:sterol desaturase/sphingolipid hydroxylase (fatty acid hydroxylase superfamily)